MIRTAVLTVSDRAYTGERPDLSGPALLEAVQGMDFHISAIKVVPDDYEEIRAALTAWSDSDTIDLVLVTGGTGFAPRDITPEATLSVIERNTPGLAEAMRLASLKITPHAMLSRAVAGIRKKTLIVNLPGSPKAAVENLQTILPVLPHAVELLRDSPHAEAGHRFE